MVTREIRYPALDALDRLTGDEPIALGGDRLSDVRGFWAWAYSNMNDNASRGRLAEYIVAKALGCADGTRREWDPFDIEWDGIKVEVKSSAYIQTWAQRELSSPSFDIRPTRHWCAETGEYEEEPRRQADVYVFCLQTCKSQEDGNPNPLDIGQWDFLVIATARLDELGGQKRISLKRLQDLGAWRLDSVRDLPDAVRKAAADRCQSLT